ncbi:MAG: WbqC family protein, partial [Bacteroidaceae bacterium]
NGPADLTIPIEKSANPDTPLYEVRISNHGNWRHLHWNALTSAYRSSPFFDYYADDFAPFYEKKWSFLIDYNEALLQLVCENMGFTPLLKRTETFGLDELTGSTNQTLDLREVIHPKHPISSGFQPQPYYQSFALKHGFQANLSCIDLLFEMGPESILTFQAHNQY